MTTARSAEHGGEAPAWKGDAWTRAVLDAAHDAIVTIDRHGVIVDANPATFRMFGYEEGELIGCNVALLMPSPYREHHDEYIARYLETREPRVVGIGRSVPGRRKDGTVFPIELALGEIGGLGMFCGVMRDVSERRGREQAILAAVSEDRRSSAQDLHDDLGALLTLVMLRLGAHVDELGRESEKCREEATAIQSLVKQALVRTRALARGLAPVGPEPEDLMASLRELAARVSDLDSVDCRFDCPKPVRVEDAMIANQLYRIAQEAVTNAVRHSQGSVIRVVLGEEAGEVVLGVRDDGRGMGAESAVGSGLEIMRFRANAIGASLAIRADVDSGTEVVCRLLVAAGEG